MDQPPPLPPSHGAPPPGGAVPPPVPIQFRNVNAPTPAPPAAPPASKGANFAKVLACAGIVFGLVIAGLVVMKVERLDYRIGYSGAHVVVTAVISAIWGAVSKIRWSWLRTFFTVLGIFLALSVVAENGRRARAQQDAGEQRK